MIVCFEAVRTAISTVLFSSWVFCRVFLVEAPSPCGPPRACCTRPLRNAAGEVDGLLREGTFCLKQSGLAPATAPGCGRFARSSVCYWYEGNNSFPVGKGRLLSPLLCTKRRRLPPTLPCFVPPCRLAIIATLISLLLRPVSSLSLYTSFSP